MLEEKARDLGRVIGQSAEYQAYKRANDALNEDREAVTILRQMDEIRDRAQRMLDRGEQPTEEMQRELDDLVTRVQVNAAYQRAISAQENYDKLMYQVNAWIADGIRKGAASSIITLG